MLRDPEGKIILVWAFTPILVAAKLFTVLYILLGLGVLAAFISELTKHRSSVIARLRAHNQTAHPDTEQG